MKFIFKYPWLNAASPPSHQHILWSTSSCTPYFIKHNFLFLLIIKCAVVFLQQLVKLSKSWPTLHADLFAKPLLMIPLFLFSELDYILGAFNLDRQCHRKIKIDIFLKQHSDATVLFTTESKSLDSTSDLTVNKKGYNVLSVFLQMQQGILFKSENNLVLS